MSGGGSSQTSKTEPWEGLKPFLSDIYSQAQTQYQGGNPSIPQFAPMHPGQEKAIGAIYDYGMFSDPSVASAQTFSQGMMDSGGNWAGSPAMPALMNIAYGGMVPTGYGTYGSTPQMMAPQTAQPAQTVAPRPPATETISFDPFSKFTDGGWQANDPRLGLTVGETRPQSSLQMEPSRFSPFYNEAVARQGAMTGDGRITIGNLQDPSWLRDNLDLSAFGVERGTLRGDLGDQQKVRWNPQTQRLEAEVRAFDEGAYAGANSDLTEQTLRDVGFFGSYDDMLRQHYFTHGENEGRSVGAMSGEVIPPGQPIPGEQGGYPMQGGYQAPQGNPFLDQMFANAAFPAANQYMTSTAPTIDAAFSRAGRYGSGMQGVAQNNAADTLARNLGGMASTIYGGAYESERGRQMQGLGLLQGGYDAGQNRALQAASMTPALAGSDLSGMLAAYNAAGTYQTQEQQRLADEQRMAMAPSQWLQQYAGILNGMPSGFGTSTTSTSGGNPLMTGLGILSSGVGIGGGLFGTGGIFPGFRF